MSDGWIKIHRQMNEWEWKDTPNTFCLFIHLLMNTNHKDKKHKGVLVKAGQIKTGRKALALNTGLSEQSIRTSLKHLESTNDVTIKSTKHYSIITITNWKKYQSTNQKLTKDQPQTRTKEIKDNNKGARLNEEWTPTDDYINFALSEGLDILQINREIDKFRDYWISRSDKGAVKKDWLATWRNWIRNNKDNYNGRTNTTTTKTDRAKEAIARGLANIEGM